MQQKMFSSSHNSVLQKQEWFVFMLCNEEVIDRSNIDRNCTTYAVVAVTFGNDSVYNGQMQEECIA